MIRARHLQVTLAAGEGPEHVPSYLDHLLGAARPATSVDRGPVDRALRIGGSFRVLGVYGARAALGRVGEQGSPRYWNDAEHELGLSRTFQIELSDSATAHRVVDGLRGIRAVESASVQTLEAAPFAVAVAARTPAHEAADVAWAPHERIHAPEAHRLEAGDERVTVGLVDTGISLGHPEFQRKLLAGYDAVDLGVDEAAGLRLVGDSRGDDFTPSDEVGHGSHVAGVIGATGWEIPPGVAGLALMLPVRVLAAALTPGAQHPSGIGAEANINCGLKVAVDLGADVLNLSFGTSEHDVDADAPKPQAPVVAYAERYGCVLVAASGNSGAAERFYPAALPEVIAVGSVDAAGKRSAFSSYGDHVSLCAPGENIVSCGIEGLREGSGTSYAAPFVTGAAALVVAHARRRGRTLAPQDVRDLLASTAAPLPGSTPHETGAGLLDVAAALRKLDLEGPAA